jgi:hypothetical protein
MASRMLESQTMALTGPALPSTVTLTTTFASYTK